MQLKRLQAIFYEHLPESAMVFVALFKQGQKQEALQVLEQQIAKAPSPALYLLFADFYRAQKNIPQMLKNAQKAFALDQKSSWVLLKLIHAFFVAESYQFCEDWLSKMRLSRKDPLLFDFYILFGNVVFKLKKYGEAALYFEKALALDEQAKEAIYFLGMALYHAGQFERASHYLERALQQDPSDMLVLHGLSSCYKLLGDYRRGIKFYLRLLRLYDLDHLRFNLSFMLLSLGKYKLAAPFYEDRELLENKVFSRGYIAHYKWQGEDLRGKTLLVYSEQGHGDNFHFARFLPRLQARYDHCIILYVVRQITKSLLKSLPNPNIYLLEEEAILKGKIILPKCDYVTHLMSLIGPMGIHPSKEKRLFEPYLFPSDARILYYQKKIEALEEKRLKVGVIWAGSPYHVNDYQRSISAEIFAPLLEAENCAFFSLQIGEHANDFGEDKLYKLLPEQPDFEESAALIVNLDLVVMIDSSIAHVTGALGKSIWCLITKDADWRWGTEGEKTPWYPSMRLIRQKEQGNWEEVITRIKGELESYAVTFDEERLASSF